MQVNEGIRILGLRCPRLLEQAERVGAELPKLVHKPVWELNLMTNANNDIIADPVAVDTWIFEASGGQRRARIEVGRPVLRDPRDPNSEWSCPLRIEGEFEGVKF